jgi:hypothetical protein
MRQASPAIAKLKQREDFLLLSATNFSETTHADCNNTLIQSNRRILPASRSMAGGIGRTFEDDFRRILVK